MQNHPFSQALHTIAASEERVVPLSAEGLPPLEVYVSSITEYEGANFFMARTGLDKHLYIVGTDMVLLADFEGIDLQPGIWECPLSHVNVQALQKHFAFTRPVLVGIADSIGLGCRLGLANAGHLRGIAGSGMKPILAQQSIRELTRTHREPEDVMDAAIWAVFQEGYHDGFGADADHLKTPDDIDRMVQAGYTMITLDPSDYVVNEADTLALDALQAEAELLPWADLRDTLDACLARYAKVPFPIADDLTITASREDVLRGLVKYGAALAHIARLYAYLHVTYSNHLVELEVSVDETDSVTSPFEHVLVASTLKRLAIPIVSLAPRFVGDFEKGIDFKGDLGLFKQEYMKHVQIAEAFGPYKISIHSGSDKFTVYDVIGSLRQGHVHIKTAGTSYLEALHAIALHDPALFRAIFDFSMGLYETEKRTYHVSADLNKLQSADAYSDAELEGLFESNDARQVLHVTFGKVLTIQNADGTYRFRDDVLRCLREHEATYNRLLERHFRRHVEPFTR